MYNAGAVALPQPKVLPLGALIPGPAFEELFPRITRDDVRFVKDLLYKPLKDRILAMSGSLGFQGSKKVQDAMFGATSFAGASPLYFGLWSSALTDSSDGSTTGESAYTAYARLSLTNNTTIFATGSGSTTYTKTFPSDAVKSFVTSTGTGSNNTITYLGIFDGNAGTSGDKLYAWCSVTSTTINNGDTPQLAQFAITVVQD